MSNITKKAASTARLVSALLNARSNIQSAQLNAADTDSPHSLGAWCEAIRMLLDQAISVAKDLDADCRK